MIDRCSGVGRYRPVVTRAVGSFLMLYQLSLSLTDTVMSFRRCTIASASNSSRTVQMSFVLSFSCVKDTGRLTLATKSRIRSERAVVSTYQPPVVAGCRRYTLRNPVGPPLVLPSVCETTPELSYIDSPPLSACSTFPRRIAASSR